MPKFLTPPDLLRSLSSKSTSTHDTSKPPKTPKTTKSSDSAEPPTPTSSRLRPSFQRSKSNPIADRPEVPRAKSHPGPLSPIPKTPQKQVIKAPARGFGNNYRVKRTPPGTPPSEQDPRIQDFASGDINTHASHPPNSSPLLSPHNPRTIHAKHSPRDILYTSAELLHRLNTIGEDDAESLAERVRTGDEEMEREEKGRWEEERLRKEEREMVEWEGKGGVGRKGEIMGEGKGKGSRGILGSGKGFSWRGVGRVVGMGG